MDTCARPSDGLVIHVAGVPRPLPRPRWVPGRARPVSIADRHAKAWARAVEAACRQAGAMAPGPVACRVSCYFPTKDAARWGRPHTGRPDTDNLVKMLLDCAERAGTLPKGDAKVARLEAEKLWARDGGAVMELRAWRAESGDAGGSSGKEKAPRAG